MAEYNKTIRASVGTPKKTCKSKAMKRYGNLYERMMAIDNLKLADEIARKGKTAKYGVRVHDAHRDENIARLHEQLERGDFKTSKYRLFTVFEPKMRVKHPRYQT